MDRVELGIKLEQISRLMDKEDFKAASRVADTIEWRKVKKWSELSIAAEAYERAERYQEARNMCVHAYNRNLGGKRLIYKLTELSIKLNDLDEADELYNEYINAAPNSVDKYILLYKLNKARNVSKERLIDILEQYKSHELDEYYEYELARLYSEAGRVSECIRECDDLVLWFADGEYVEKALRLKLKHAPLTKTQQAKLDMIEECRAAGMEYEYNLPDVDDKNNDEAEPQPEGGEINSTEEPAAEAELPEENDAEPTKDGTDNEIKVPVQDFSIYDTQNIQEALAKSLEELINGSASDAAEVEAFKAAMPVIDTPGRTESVVDIDNVNKEQNVAIKREEDEPEEVDEPTKEIRINTHHWKRVVSVMEEPEKLKDELPKYLVAKNEFEGEIDTDSDIVITEITELFADEEELKDEAVTTPETDSEQAEASVEESEDETKEVSAEPESGEAESETADAKEADSEEEKSEMVDAKESDTEEEKSEMVDAKEADTEEEESETADSETITDTEKLPEEDVQTQENPTVDKAVTEETAENSDSPEAVDEEFIEGQINIMEWMDTMKNMPPVEGPVYTIPDPVKVAENNTPSEQEVAQTVKETEDEVTRQLMEAVAENLREEQNEKNQSEEEPEAEILAKNEVKMETETESLADVDTNNIEKQETEVETEMKTEPDAEEEPETENTVKAENAVSEEELAQAVKKTEEEIAFQLAQAVNEEIDLAQKENSMTSESTEDEVSAETKADIEKSETEEDDVSVEETLSNGSEDAKTDEEKNESEEAAAAKENDEDAETDEEEPQTDEEEPQADEEEPQADEEEPQTDEEEPLIKESERKYLNKYLFMQGMETSIIEVLYGKRNEVPDGTSAKGNIVIVGRSKTDKTGFAINLFKAMHVDDEKKTLKIAKTTAAILNRNGIDKVKDKIKGSTLIIEHAGQLNKNIVTELTEFMQGDTGSMLVILTGEDFSIKRIFSENREFEELFGYRIEIKHYSVNELVEVAKEYARIQGYTIEEKAMLKVYLKVSDIEGDDNGTDLDSVRILIDDAIKHNKQRGGARFGRKRNGLIALKSKDFGK